MSRGGSGIRYLVGFISPVVGSCLSCPRRGLLRSFLRRAGLLRCVVLLIPSVCLFWYLFCFHRGYCWSPRFSAVLVLALVSLLLRVMCLFLVVLFPGLRSVCLLCFAMYISVSICICFPHRRCGNNGDLGLDFRRHFAFQMFLFSFSHLPSRGVLFFVGIVYGG